MFKNIEESRLIYKKIQLFGELLIDSIKSKTLCDKNLEALKEENLLLKTVIAKNEVIKKSQINLDNDNLNANGNLNRKNFLKEMEMKNILVINKEKK